MHTISNSGVTPARTFAARETRVLPVEQLRYDYGTFIMLIIGTDVIWTTAKYYARLTFPRLVRLIILLN